MIIQGWFPLGLTGLISLQFRELSRIFSSTTIHNFFKEGFCPVLTNMLVSLLILIIPSSVFKLILSSEFQTCVFWCQLNISCTSDPISENEFILLLWIYFSHIISSSEWVASSVQSTAQAKSMSHLGSFCRVFMDPHSVIQMLIFLYWAYLEFVLFSDVWADPGLLALHIAVFSSQSTFPLLCLANPHCFWAE